MHGLCYAYVMPNPPLATARPRAMTREDFAFAAFIEACESMLTIASLAHAFAQGRGSALAEAARVPSPSSSADRHRRYSAGVRTPPMRRPCERNRAEAAKWGWVS